jgi:hypothetical protein
LQKYVHSGAWLFVTYDHLFQASTLDRIEAFSGHALDRTLVDSSLNRSRAEQASSAEAESIYLQLLERSQASSWMLKEPCA